MVGRDRTSVEGVIVGARSRDLPRGPVTELNGNCSLGKRSLSFNPYILSVSHLVITRIQHLNPVGSLQRSYEMLLTQPLYKLCLSKDCMKGYLSLMPDDFTVIPSPYEHWH
jgi:hypothetical protein